MLPGTTLPARGDGHWQRRPTSPQDNTKTHLEGIIGGEVNIEEKDPTRIRRILWSHDRCLPMKHIVTNRTGGAIGRRILAQIDQFLFCNNIEEE
jgi:hypothetical protein